MNGLAFVQVDRPSLPPSPGGCVVVAVDLVADEATEAACVAMLGVDERERRQRLVRAVDRRRFAVARGLLRGCLALCTGVAPRRIAFRYGQRGRPELETAAGRGDPAFNVSHSGDHLLMAFADAATVGIDVEDIGGQRDEEAIARRFFAAAEIDELLGCDPPARPRAFLNGWTRKEALIKAEGEGIFSALERFTVSLGNEARLREVAGDPTAAARWRLYALDGGEAWVGALALPGEPGRVDAIRVSAPAILACAAAEG